MFRLQRQRAVVILQRLAQFDGVAEAVANQSQRARIIRLVPNGRGQPRDCAGEIAGVDLLPGYLNFGRIIGGRGSSAWAAATEATNRPPTSASSLGRRVAASIVIFALLAGLAFTPNKRQDRHTVRFILCVSSHPAWRPGEDDWAADRGCKTRRI